MRSWHPQLLQLRSYPKHLGAIPSLMGRPSASAKCLQNLGLSTGKRSKFSVNTRVPVIILQIQIETCHWNKILQSHIQKETLKHPFGPTHHNNWARGPPHLLFRLVVTLYQLYAMCTLHWNSLNLQNSLAENSAEIWNDGSKLPGSLFPCCKFSLLHDFSCMILTFRTQYNQNVFLDFSIKKGSKTLHQ